MSRNPYLPPETPVLAAASRKPRRKLFLDPVLRVGVAIVMIGLAGMSLLGNILDWDKLGAHRDAAGAWSAMIALGVSILVGLLLLSRSRFALHAATVQAVIYIALLVVQGAWADLWMVNLVLVGALAAILLLASRLKASGSLR